MCRSSSEPGGPKRCSGDTRASYGHAVQEVDRLEQHAQALSRSPRRIDTALHAALRAAVLRNTDADPDELDREVAAAIAAGDDQARREPAPARSPATTVPQRKAQCFFCDTVIDTDAAAHMTRYGKVCCRQCWPDIRLTQGPAGGLSAAAPADRAV